MTDAPQNLRTKMTRTGIEKQTAAVVASERVCDKSAKGRHEPSLTQHSIRTEVPNPKYPDLWDPIHHPQEAMAVFPGHAPRGILTNSARKIAIKIIFRAKPRQRHLRHLPERSPDSRRTPDIGNNRGGADLRRGPPHRRVAPDKMSAPLPGCSSPPPSPPGGTADIRPLCTSLAPSVGSTSNL